MPQSIQFKITALFLLFFAIASAQTFEPTKRILYLSSYHSEFNSSSEHFTAVSHLVNHAGRELDVIYMDTKRRPMAERFPITYEQIRENVQSNGSYDVILSSDDNALKFLLQYKDELLGSIPVIFFGINDHELARGAAQRADFSGILEQNSLRENAELAFDLFPDLGTLHVITDPTTTGQAQLKSLLENLTPELRARLQVEDLSHQSFSELAEQLHSYPENDAILLLAAYTDKEGTQMGFLDLTLWFKRHTQRPIICPYTIGIGLGYVGGKVVSHYQMAQLATTFAEDYLNGELLPENLLVEDCGNIYTFDYKELQRHQLRISQLPEGAVILDEPQSIYTKYKGYFITAFIVSVLLAACGVVIGFIYLKQRTLLISLKESEGQTAGLFKNSSTPILLIAPQGGKILDANPAALDYYGYSKLELSQLNLSEIDGGAFVAMDDVLERVTAGERKSYQFKHRLRNGEQRTVEVLFICIQQHEEPVLFSIVQDTTERRHMEEVLAAEQTRLSNILSGTHVGTWEWNVEASALRLNQYWAEMIGYRLEELAPVTVETWSQLCHPDDLKIVMSRMNDHFEGRTDYYACELRMKHKNGSWVWIMDRGKLATRTQEGKPEWMYGTHQDITEIKNHEAALIEAKEAAEAASQAKNVFLATMSHELRTPLNPILGFTDLLLETTDLPDEQRGWLKIIKSRSKDLLQLIEDILDIARIEAGRLTIETTPCLVQDILDDIYSIFERPCADKGLTLKFEIAPELNVPCCFDPTRIRQILLNLVSNAIKFSESGAIQLIAKLETGRESDPIDVPILHLTVRDQGPGIPEEQHEVVFQEFQQLDGSHSRAHEGVGLGLAICKRLTKMMGGTIWVNPDYKQGAEFHVQIPAPLQQATPDEPPVVEVTNEKSAAPTQNASTTPVAISVAAEAEKEVLLVEDEPSNAQLIKTCLKQRHFHVTHAKNGREAVELCTSQRFSIILMDLKMPGMGGFEATRILRQRGNTTPIIAITALAFQDDQLDLIDAGMDGGLQKPVTPKALLAIIDKNIKN
ncbi:diguanylate cyclase/phosphodiesterase (GGDEF & EAL domains) with PAS/PAC sensor(s) [Lentimonas sp. CC4]|nr:diguanylate cyclase/phosphodiesterase (GGDEF & EAL domains) with PAS/PAC sensor(s) [Lentimonas sp. CC4]CAA6685706.1 diguanylate cyclase/phosphodiesterase (GGDEF & EAL domains) with PAS/PAC sensor(s) [Lentimonas sp. CC6]CAA7077149.1 diguanylate cyclase/phosphodiesterase (GGDEF & EAL domains) with PAS/PAC sensor(s) [Lentimonas sp. CC4]CAA7168768.1 diguanylate cyclase/phosphodiesterase (GGDEF & EAL domains) with PAS/PAC sensor(s) [Lentimonas sp. CC21]CAA7180865.1 diguanylate cyclase/phosphodies